MISALEGKRIWISGASSGIGRACAIAANHAGAFVVLVGRNKEELEKTREQLPRRQDAQLILMDLTDFDALGAAIEKNVSPGREVDGVVNAAGISTTLPFRNTTNDKMEEFFRVNVQASLFFTKHLLRATHFSKTGGSVIFITSVMGHVGESGKVLYSMSKGALIAAGRSLALEMASRGIRVNCISPGVVETPMYKNAYYAQDEAGIERIRSLHPMGLGKPEDVANACTFLLSDQARWITGTQLVVDGGYTAR